ncbi:hypothetical protein [Paraburkholderia sp.]|uniref:hypothetical protein n=1 Tax=Paraburkholderia sp. TaxID=1926495 RepID=UPI002D356BD8|nr:hypothetical protein [Paraburkholderia sp.]HZZ04614.1 hypothetical protein [Paraburkholderia sp.]
MSGPSILVFKMPTMANPEAFDSVMELRRELHRTNRELLDLAATAQNYQDVGTEVSITLHKILLMYLTGFAQLSEYLMAYLDERPRLREALEEALESASMQQVH